MAKKPSGTKSEPVGTRSTASQTSSGKGKVRDAVESVPTSRHRSSALVDTRVIYCGDNLEQLQKGQSYTFEALDSGNPEHPLEISVVATFKNEKDNRPLSV